MLTGGVSASKVYKILGKSKRFHKLKNVKFYFGDERCVPINHQDSNFNMVMQTLFFYGIPEGCAIERINVDSYNQYSRLADYETMMPDYIDLLLLSIGEDGHIASLFPGDQASEEMVRLVSFVRSPKSPFQRVTITPKMIKRAHNIFLFALGSSKGRILAKGISENILAKDFPVKYAMHGTWLLDFAAMREMESTLIECL